MVLDERPGRFECPCGAPPFCTHCRQSPYHFHAVCADVQPLRERWLKWLSMGREMRVGRERSNATYLRQVRALQDGIQRHQELESDEMWKAANCRRCPGCGKPVQKNEGCDAMKCGQDFHGGGEQPGCGLRFEWGKAKPYVKQVDSRPLVKITAKAVAIRGNGAFHPNVHCDMCGAPGDGLAGIRFRCIHCPSFNVCRACEPQVATVHDVSHVFETLYETEFDWTKVCLPSGTKVRIVRHGTTLPPRLNHLALEGKFGAIDKVMPAPTASTGLSGHGKRYRVKLLQSHATGPGPRARWTRDVSYAIIPQMHVEPIILSRGGFEKLMERVEDAASV